ncbi:MAG: DUF1501 domain-containing protein [Planctomycetota bacterium]
MNEIERALARLDRRRFLARAAGGLGFAALSSLGLPGVSAAARSGLVGALDGGRGPHFPPTAKRVIYLFMSGGPSHIDLFDWKDSLPKIHGQELPDSIRGGQRITGMTSGQTSFPAVQPKVPLRRRGERGTWISELLPHIGGIADRLAIVRSMHTEAINHDPAITYIQTGTQQLGKPSIGSWVSWGLGSDNADLPAYVVLLSRTVDRGNAQPLFSRLWSSGFLPSNHQGVKFRSGKDPVLFLNDPAGLSKDDRRAMLDGLRDLNEEHFAADLDPETETRIDQYELAYRMQTSVPDLTDISREPDSTFALYGEDARKPGTFASNCLLARRMAERGVRFIQLFHRGWDNHNGLNQDLPRQCKDVDQATAGLIEDLARRGLLEDTLVVWGGEFGRTIYSQGKIGAEVSGRDHHGRCFSTFLCGGGIEPGIDYGETDDWCWNVAKDPVHIRDLSATILHTLGLDHERLTFRFQGLDQKLTGVEPARVVRELLA